MISYVLKLIRTGTIIVYIFSFIAMVLSIFLYYDGKKSRKQKCSDYREIQVIK